MTKFPDLLAGALALSLACGHPSPSATASSEDTKRHDAVPTASNRRFPTGSVSPVPFEGSGLTGKRVSYMTPVKRVTVFLFLQPLGDCMPCYSRFLNKSGRAMLERRESLDLYVIYRNPPTAVTMNLLSPFLEDSDYGRSVMDTDGSIANSFGIPTTPYFVAVDEKNRLLLAAGVSAVDGQQAVWSDLVESLFAVK